MSDDNSSKMTSFIDKLISDSEVSHNLQLFHRWIFSLETSELMKLVAELDFTPLFENLFQAEAGNIDIVLEIFHKLINTIPVGTRIPRLRELFLHGLKHDSPKIKEVILKQLKVCIEDNEAIDQLSKDQCLMTNIAKQIGDTSLSVATCSADILISFGRRGEMINLILSSEINQILWEIVTAAGNDAGKFRVYEIIMKLASISSEGLDLVATNGYFEIFLTDIKSKDELTLLNCLEVSKELIVTNHGLKFLNDLGIISVMVEMTFETNSDPLMRCLILPGLLKFFMNFGRSQPEYLFNYHSPIIDLYFSLLEEVDPVLLCIAVDGIGLLGSSVRGKLLLNESGKMPIALKHFGTILATHNPDVKYNVLQALARLLRIEDHEKHVNPEFQSVLYDWFKLVSEDTGELVFKICRQPFEEVHHGALCIMSAIVAYEWGQKIVVSIPGFIEFLLNRATENSVPGKEVKFKIVETLMTCAILERILDKQIIVELKEYYQKGPFYITARNTVAVEDPL